ncbi:MAG: MerR family transcriptional regulator [Nocardioidaceae bacterium]
MGIGEVLRRLRQEFPDVSVSKIRFLESEGLVEPARAASGYRKFSHADVERLRYVLAAQRDHYLPLKVIREHLDAIARGLEPPAVAGAAPRVPRAVSPDDESHPVAPQIRMSRVELLANSGLSGDELADLQVYGLVRPLTGSEHFDAAALTVATTVAALSRHGLEPRHLRLFKTAADRESGLIEQIVAPVARQRDDEAGSRAADLRRELARLTAQLHDALVSSALAGPD